MEINNWDVVYACSGSYINEQLAANPDEYIHAFTYEDAVISVTGTFGAWQLVPGGSGLLLQFHTPIAEGSLSFKGTSDVVSLSGTVPLVEMQLTLQADASQTGTQNLVFNCATLGSGTGDTTPGAVSVILADTSGKLALEPNGPLAAELLLTALGNCLLQHASQIAYVFANVLPVPTGKNSDWLTPQVLTYGYQQPTSNVLGGLAILGLLSPGESSTLPHYFDYTLLTGYDFGFVLGARPFMQNVIMPSLPAAFGGNTVAGDFALNDINIIFQKAGFNLNAVTVGLIDYTPSVTGLSFQITDTSMRCYVATRTDITGLSDAYVTNSVTSNNAATFNVSTRTLSFSPDPHQAVTQDSSIPWWEAVLGALTLGIMDVVVASISLAIENAVGDLVASKTAQSLGSVAPGLVSWRGQSAVTITAGGLADNVYMQGTLK